MNILITGAAGFIGSALSQRLLADGHFVTGIDNLNDYYDPKLKLARLNHLTDPKWRFYRIDISDRFDCDILFREHHFDVVINLAAQAGVRYSVTNPHAYIDSNITGFLNILEGCKTHGTPLIYASTSSVYGTSTQYPFSEDDPADHPVALYGATKRANELMAHAYHHLYGFPTVGLRFFTVYGPWGRPDMALFKFTKNILNGEPIDVYNRGYMLRNFTYIDDIVEGLTRLTQTPLSGYHIYNLGNPVTTSLMDYISEIEKATGKKAIFNMLPMQPGDIAQNPADTHRFTELTGFTPKTQIAEGVSKFVAWYMNYHSASQANLQPDSNQMATGT